MYYASAPLDYHRVAAYLDRILRGEKPGDLPVQFPVKYGMAVNLKTANALGLRGATVDSAARGRGDRVKGRTAGRPERRLLLPETLTKWCASE